jgi:GT2 family glycosyltransferase
MSEAAVLIATFNGREFLEECLGSVLGSNDGDLKIHVVVIDNASGDGSVDLVRERFPSAHLVQLPENRGFAGANNAGWEFAREKFPGVEFVAVLNHDTVVKSGWLGGLVSYLKTNPTCAAVQPKILLWPKTERINTVGNRSHYLGFGIVSAYGKLDDGSWNQARKIDFPSGAAFVVRANIVETFGLFDDEFFLYLEDADLGWKIRQSSLRIDYSPAGVVWHKYAFQRNYEFYYYLERNRWILLLTYYKWATLVVLSPALVLMEIGQFFFACANGVGGQKLRAWRYFWCAKNISYVRKRRSEARGRRKISDREFTKDFVGEIDFPEIQSTVLRVIGNPLLNIYWKIVRPLIFW